MLYLHCISLIPTVWKGKPISIDKANELPVMLDFVLKEVERKFNLYVGQIREVDFIHLLMRCFQSSKHRLLETRRFQTTRESFPTACLDCFGITFTSPDDTPQLTCDSVGW